MLEMATPCYVRAYHRGMLLRRLPTLLVILFAPISAQVLEIGCDTDWEECDSAESEGAMFSLLQMPGKVLDPSFRSNLSETIDVGSVNYSCAALGMEDDDGKCVREETLPGGRAKITISQVSRSFVTNTPASGIALDLTSGVHITTFHGAFAKVQTIKNRSLSFAESALASTSTLLATDTQPAGNVNSTGANATSNALHADDRKTERVSRDWQDVIDKIGTKRIRRVLNVTVETLTVVTVVVASPSEILLVYAGMFSALILVYLVSFLLFETTPALYVALLSLTIGVTHISFALVNVSLGQVMQAPNAITSVQAAFMMLSCGLWCYFRGEKFPEGARCKMFILGCCCAYAVFQIIQHECFRVATLSERVVYLNLASPLALILELLLLPSVLKPPVNFRSIFALILLLSGLLIFCVGGIGFEQWVFLIGISTALAHVVAKLAERTVLCSYTSLPVVCVGLGDGVLMTIVTCALSFTFEDNLVTSWGLWLKQPGVALMLVLSMFIFVADHLLSLAMLRVGSTTNFVVISNMAGVANVLLGNFLFADNVASSMFKLGGLVINFIGGFWFTLELQNAYAPKLEWPEADSSPCHKAVQRL